MRNALLCIDKVTNSMLTLVLLLSLSSTQLYSINESYFDFDCNRSPVITCPQNYFGCEGDSSSPDDIGWATAVAGEAGCDIPVISYTDKIESNDDCNGGILIKRLWRADYPNNSNPWLFAECTQIILLEDTDTPIISNCPSDIVVNSDQSCSAVVSWTAPVATDDCTIISFTSNYASGSTFPSGITTVTYTAIDACGRTSQCSFTITVNETCCTELPVISCPPTYSTCIGYTIDPLRTGMATASFSDAGCGTPVVTYEDITIGAAPGCEGALIIDRIWTATHPNHSDLRATCTQRIRMEDVEPPVIENLPGDITVTSNDGCDAIVTWEMPKAVDNCAVTFFMPSIANGSRFSPGTTTVTYTALDRCQNSSSASFNVTVIESCCNENPIISCPQDVTLCVGSSIDPSITGRPSAFFNNDQCGTPNISYTDVVQSIGQCTGARTIRRVWTASHATDPNLNSTCDQIITLRDDTAPILSECPDDIVQNTISTSGIVVLWDAPTATDDCGVASVTSNMSSGSVFRPGVHTVTYTALDFCGNSTSCTFTITVNLVGCTETPILNCPNDYSACVGSSIDPAVTGQATASFISGTCEPASVTYEDITVATGTCNNSRTIQRIWMATSISDPTKFVSCIQNIVLGDTQAPVITSCPSDITLTNTNAAYTWNDPIVSDDCGYTISNSVAKGSTFPIGNTTVVVTATDDCGNSTSCSFVVTVNQATCTEIPTIACGANYVGCIGGSIDPSVTGRPSTYFVSNVCGTPDLTYTDRTISNGPCNGQIKIERTWRATNIDNPSLVRTCIQIIELKDEEAPAISSCPSDVTLSSDNPVYTWSDPVVSDNCGYNLTSSVAKGSTFPIGTTTVVITATDGCGNSTTCSFVVTVETENVGSTLLINCPDDIVMLCDEEEAIDYIPLPEVNTDCELCNGGEIPGFIYMGAYNGNQYYCSRDKATWESAKLISESNGGYLAIINSPEENSFIAGLLQTNAAYIGLSDRSVEGNFKWVDGSDLSYTNWYPQQPNNYRGYQDYVELLRNGLWNDQYNNKPLEFVMEVPCYTITQTAGPDDMAMINEPTTVSYEVVDACGNVQSCSFDIVVEQTITFSCPDDVNAQTGGDFATVIYDEPEFNSCCMAEHNTSTGTQIDGYLYMGYFNGSYYYCSREDLSWHDANKECRRNGGYLAVINSPEENSFLANQLITQTAFIGISDHLTEGDFAAVNGQQIGFFNWDEGQPNNHSGTQHYVEMAPTGHWNDNHGSVKREYIMEIPAGYHYTLIEGLPSGAHFPVGTTTITYRGSDACGNTDVCSFDVTVTSTNTGSGAYCESYSTNSNYAYINEGLITNKLFQTGNNGGYGNFEAYCVDVVRGETVSVRFTPGFNSYRYYCYYHIFIDYNGDGDFEDYREHIGTAKSASTITGDLPILDDAVLGKVRMRVVMSLSGYPSSACEVLQYGEVEDYCLNIVPGTSNGYVGKTRSIDISPIVLDSKGDDWGALEKNNVPEPIISPNPASHSFKIDSKGLALANVQLLSMDGKVVKEIRDTSRTQNISDLPAGLYLIKMTDQMGETYLEKMIIER